MTETIRANKPNGGGVRRLIALMGLHRGKMFLAMLFTVTGTAFQIVPFILIYLMVIELLDAPVDQALVWRLAIWSVIAVILRFGLKSLGSTLSHISAYQILRDIRAQLAEKLGQLSLGYFNEKNTGEIKSVMLENVEQLEIFLAHHTVDIAAAITVPLATLIYLFTLDWRLALATLATILIALALMMAWMGSKGAQEAMAKMICYEGKVNSAIIEYIQGMPVIKAFNQTVASFARYKDTVVEFTQWKADLGRAQNRPMATFFVLLGAALLPILPLGAWFYLDGSLALETYILFLLLAPSVGPPLVKLMDFPSRIGRILEGEKLIYAILTAETLPEPATPQTPTTHDIAFRDVDFSYGKTEILHGVGFTAPEGTVTALVGPSGAGKTTVGRLIPRFWDVTGGEIQIGGVNVKDIERETLMDQIAFVFQDVSLFNDTVLENIRMGKPEATEDEVIVAAKLAQAHDFITAMPNGYHTVIGEQGARISGGEKQRLSIARAILKDAPIVVLDEATAFIDPENEARVQEALGILTANKTLIVIAHRLSTVTEADQILVFDEGRIVARGTHSELLESSALYRSMWQAHQTAQNWSFDTQPAVSGQQSAPSGQQPAASNTHHLPITPRSSLPAAQANIFQKIYRVAGDYSKKLNTSIIYRTLSAFFAGAPLGFVYLTLNGLFDDTLDMAQVLLYVAGMAVSLALEWYFRACAGEIDYVDISEQLTRNLVLDLGEHIRRLSLGFFTRRDTGDMAATLTTDQAHIEFIYMAFFPQVVSAAALTLVMSLFLLVLDWRMALAALIALPVAAAVVTFTQRVNQRLGERRQEELVRVNSRIIEYVQGIRAIQAFNQTGERFTTLSASLDDFERANIEMSLVISPLLALVQAVIELGFACILLVGACLLFGGNITVANLLIFLIVSLRFYTPLQRVAVELTGEMNVFGPSLDRVVDLMNIPPLAEPETDRELDHLDVEFRDVTFSYQAPAMAGLRSPKSGAGRRDVTLQDICLTIPECSMTALVGPSGSGKTTITNLIARFWDVDEGAMLIGGVNVKDLKTNRLLSCVSFVFQDVYLFNDTIGNNIRFGKSNATEEEVIAAARTARCHDFISQLPDGYGTMVGEGGATLSGGEKQRVSIARAILKNAPIVLLDEATASVDPENELAILQAINELVKSKTVIMIAHRLPTVRNAGQILVVDEGRIVQRGTHSDLITQKGLYRRFWEERQKARGWKIGMAGA